MKLNGDLNYEKKALKALLGSDDIIFFDFETGGHHRALADCRYTAQLFMRVLKKIKAREMPAEELKERFASPPELLGRA